MSTFENNPHDAGASGDETNLSRRSIIWRLILPVPIALLATIAAIWLVVPSMVADNARTEAVRSGQQTVNQFKTIRGYYTKNVIKKVLANGGVKPSVNHAKEADGIPLPATFIHDVSALLAQNNTTVDLYSAFPFPNRADRQLDSFQSEAWAYLNANPDGVYARQSTEGGVETVRVAVADRLVAEGCVKCHNTHPASPKTDWRLGDVRGVVEVKNVITAQIAAGNALGNRLVMGAAVIGLVLTALAWASTRSVSGPLTAMVEAMKRLAKGDVDVVVPNAGRGEELCAMADAIEVFRDQAVHQAQLEQDKQAEQKRSAARVMSLEDTTSGFERTAAETLETCGSSADALQHNARTMVEVANATVTRADRILDKATEASQNNQTVASAAQQLSQSVSEISVQATKAAEVAGRASERATKSNAQVKGLAEAADEIGKVVSLIADIAEQTNLLALNATIEAARAGEMGKGFAVVATEVKSLAAQTARATEDISGQVREIQQATHAAVEAIEEIGETINEMDTISASIAGAVEEQGTATRDIATNINTAAEAAQSVSQESSDVKSAASEADQAAQKVLSAAQELRQRLEAHQVEVANFLQGVKTA